MDYTWIFLCALGIGALAVLAVLSWLVVKLVNNNAAEKKRIAAIQRRRELILKYGTPQEKTNVLLEMQNERLEQLNDKASWAAVYLMTHGGPPGSGPI